MPRDEQHSEQMGGVPERLRQVTIETLPPEELYTLDIDNDTHPQEVICIDEAQSRLVIDRHQTLKPFDEIKAPDDKTIIFMAAWVPTGEGGVRRGIVADCRFYEGRFDVVNFSEEIDFSDQESAWEELNSRRCQVVIAGVIDDSEEDGTVQFLGDPAFRDAAMYMAKLVDADHEPASSQPKKAVDKPKQKGKKSKKKK